MHPRLTVQLFFLLFTYLTVGHAHNVPGLQASLAPMLKQTMPGVVNVTAHGKIPLFRRFPKPSTPIAPREPKYQSIGSGVIVDAEKGYILTNSHVVYGSRRIRVMLSDGRHFDAKLIGQDPSSDIAVLQVHSRALHAIPFGDSEHLRVGDFVLAIGNPFGLNQTVTSGIVSALGRSDLGIEGYENFIQTDAAVNRGNSGGALVDLEGHLLGVNTAILTPDGGNVGISFAIPSNMARSVMLQLIKYGKVKRGLLGVMVQNFSPELANAFHLSQQSGAVITNITPHSPADHSALKVGDVIIAMNGTPITSAAAVRNMTGLRRIGDEIDLTVLRGHQKQHHQIKIADPTRIIHHTAAKNPLLFGVDQRNLHQQLQYHGPVRGVQILNVDESSAAWGSGLRPGDIIVEAKRHPIRNMLELENLLTQEKNKVLIRVLRGSGSLFLVLQARPEESL